MSYHAHYSKKSHRFAKNLREMKIKNLRHYGTLISALLPIVPLSAKTQKSNTAVKNRQQPNVIIILADDLGYGDIGCFGATRVQTPNVNALAQSGIRFTNVHAIAATSTPSRYGLLTGEYAFRHPNTDIARGNAGMIIRPEQFTVADAFKNAGYTTAAIGKWHLGLGDKDAEQDWNAQLPMHPGDIGFDYHYIMAATADRTPCVFIEQGHVANYDASAPILVSYDENFPGEPTGKENPELLYNLKASHGHNQSIVNGIGRIGYMKGGGKALWKDENIADSIAAHAIDFMQKHQQEPFFMYLATNDIHVPRFPHDRFRGKNPMGFRGDAIAQFDWTVGQIIRELERLHLRENTLIILSSDNGPVVDDGYQDRAVELLGDHRPAGPYRAGKYSTFEGGTMVPTIVSWPKIVQGGQESDALISQIDWLASLSALIGARIPKGGGIDSQNRLSTLLGKDKKDRPYVLEQAANHALSVRTKKWKYIPPSQGPAVITGPNMESGYARDPQLYDMQLPYEQENVALQQPKVVFELQSYIEKERNGSVTYTSPISK